MELEEQVVGLLVGGGQVVRGTGLDGDGAHRVARCPSEDALSPGRDGDDEGSSGSDVLEEELDEPVEVSTPTIVIGTPLTSTVWPTGCATEELRSGRCTQHADGSVVLDVLIVDEAPFGQGRPRTVSQFAVEPWTVVVAVWNPR